MKRWQVDGTLLLVVMMWGSTFFVVHDATKHWNPIAFVALRFALASAALLPWALPGMRRWTRADWRAGLILGLLLTAGYIIEKQFRTAAGVVLATSCDCPYEERTTFYLLDEQLGVADEVTCFTPYDTWLLDRMEPLDERSFRVVFYAEFACVLRILPRDAGGWRLDLGR
jgi:hypothetical protein